MFAQIYNLCQSAHCQYREAVRGTGGPKDRRTLRPGAKEQHSRLSPKALRPPLFRLKGYLLRPPTATSVDPKRPVGVKEIWRWARSRASLALSPYQRWATHVRTPYVGHQFLMLSSELTEQIAHQRDQNATILSTSSSVKASVVVVARG
jgi:hypothetical protein